MRVQNRVSCSTGDSWRDPWRRAFYMETVGFPAQRHTGVPSGWGPGRRSGLEGVVCFDPGGYGRPSSVYLTSGCLLLP